MPSARLGPAETAGPQDVTRPTPEEYRSAISPVRRVVTSLVPGSQPPGARLGHGPALHRTPRLRRPARTGPRAHVVRFKPARESAPSALLVPLAAAGNRRSARAAPPPERPGRRGAGRSGDFADARALVIPPCKFPPACGREKSADLSACRGPYALTDPIGIWHVGGSGTPKRDGNRPRAGDQGSGVWARTRNKGTKTLRDAYFTTPDYNADIVRVDTSQR
jgi:hypothetical protein